MISSVRYSKIPYVLVVIDGGIGKAFMRPFIKAVAETRLKMLDLVIGVT
jgi:hypothetical protein